MWFVYILECVDGTLYTGVTNNLEKRFAAHQGGKGGSYTRSHPPKNIAYKERVDTQGNALRREAAIKQMTRAQKQKLIRFHTA